MLKTDGHRVKVKVTYLAARQLVKVDPKESLEPGRYVVKIRTGITDVLGNPLDGKPKPGEPAREVEVRGLTTGPLTA